METIDFLLYLLAAICFVLAAANRPPLTYTSLLPLGLFFWVLVPLIDAVKHLS